MADEYVPPTAEQLALYLDLAEINGERADLLIEQATALAETVVRPLPAGASSIVLAIAVRTYAHPVDSGHQTIGPMSVSGLRGGLRLTREEKSALRAAAGRGGAFSMDPTPATADPSPTWPAYEEGW